MRNRSFRTAAVILALLTLLTVPAAALGEGAQQPYTSYTYWTDIGETRKAVYSRPMYETGRVLGAADLGVNALSAIQDLCTDSKGNLYLLDKASRIVVLDSGYHLLRELRQFTAADGAPLTFDGARSLYVHTDGTLFLCDTDHAQVLHADAQGKVLETYGLPDSPLIPDDFQFRPLRAVMDSHGYLYVLSDGSYYGALLYAPDGSFTGFYGANKVTTGIASTLRNVLDRMFPNNARKSASARSLPYCFVDLTIDAEDFVYTATGKTDTYDRAGQIKKLNPGAGKNILGSEEVNFTDDAFNTTHENGKPFEQDIIGLAVSPDGYLYCLDGQFGRVFLYDSDCRMLTAFGGGMQAGVQDGSFRAACALTLNGRDVVVGDSAANTLTVFTPTAFGAQVLSLIDLTAQGEYLQAKAGWQDVLSQDRNFQPAYSGLARASLTEGDYKTAMELSKAGYDRETYQLAFELQRKDNLRSHFWLIFLGAVVLIGAVAALLIVSMRRRVTIIRSPALRLMLTTPLHPINSFADIKEKGAGSIPLCLVLLLLFYVTAVLQVLCGGFLFTHYDPAGFNSVWVLVRSVGLVVLWIISNWMICTLLQGKGKMREICIVTCYSLTPMIVERLLRLVLTNALLPNEAIFLGTLDAIALFYTLLLISIGLIRIHDFGLGRFLGTSALSIGWVAVLVFLLVLIGMLLQQLGGFLLTVFTELIS